MAGGPVDAGTSRQARTVALVLVGTVVLWLLAQWVGGRIGLDVRYVFLFDLAAGAAFVWALIVTIQIWRKRRGS